MHLHKAHPQTHPASTYCVSIFSRTFILNIITHESQNKEKPNQVAVSDDDQVSWKNHFSSDLRQSIFRCDAVFLHWSAPGSMVTRDVTAGGKWPPPNEGAFREPTFWNAPEGAIFPEIRHFDSILVWEILLFFCSCFALSRFWVRRFSCIFGVHFSPVAPQYACILAVHYREQKFFFREWERA